MKRRRAETIGVVLLLIVLILAIVLVLIGRFGPL